MTLFEILLGVSFILFLIVYFGTVFNILIQKKKRVECENCSFYILFSGERCCQNLELRGKIKGTDITAGITNCDWNKNGDCEHYSYVGVGDMKTE